MSNTVAGRRQFDNSQECIAKKRQWRRHANENTLEQNTSIANGKSRLVPSTSHQGSILRKISGNPDGLPR